MCNRADLKHLNYKLVRRRGRAIRRLNGGGQEWVVIRSSTSAHLSSVSAESGGGQGFEFDEASTRELKGRVEHRELDKRPKDVGLRLVGGLSGHEQMGLSSLWRWIQTRGAADGG